LITLNLSSLILAYNLYILALIPLGGSVVTFRDFWRIVMGNLGVGLDDKKKSEMLVDFLRLDSEVFKNFF